MTEEDFWLPLVDEPIDGIVQRLLDGDATLPALVATPERQLAFRAFACVRIGMLLGQLLIERDVEFSGTETWIDELLADPEVVARLTEAVREVAQKVAADPEFVEHEPIGPDEAARERFLKFVREVTPDP